MTTEATLALKQAAPWLARRDRTREEVVGWMLSRGHSQEVAQEAVDWLTAKRFVSDERVANDTVARLGGTKGREAIASRLMARGVSEPDLAQALAGFDEEAERLAAEAILDQRPALRSDPAKAGRFLSARGFSEQTVLSIIEDLGLPHEAD
ncbi:MAG: regulatory protein RecX [Fimbriimonadaceae bacterium]|nr:regulatory protein RecX [Fimbriimonadaceae bacterium]QYK57979.1 MAG: regulatory protein RecX [Fimbriimonadaceae bacterium]